MLANTVFSRLGRYVSTVVVSDEGLKPFLYGRDVLKASVTNVYPKLRRKDIAFVVGSDGYVYGVGISLVDDSTINDLGRNDVVVKNVFDVGWYLRGGTEPREKKFKT
jgi:ribosome biogenesis protein Nip4